MFCFGILFIDVNSYRLIEQGANHFAFCCIRAVGSFLEFTHDEAEVVSYRLLWVIGLLWVLIKKSCNLWYIMPVSWWPDSWCYQFVELLVARQTFRNPFGIKVLKLDSKWASALLWNFFEQIICSICWCCFNIFNLVELISLSIS